MTLAAMVLSDEEAFICDMAETYHILDYEALPVDLLAVLACGLRDNSRIKMKMSGLRNIPIELVIPQIFDQITLLRWGLSGQKKAPPLLTDLMREPEKPEYVGFKTGEDFMARWRELTGDNNG